MIVGGDESLSEHIRQCLVASWSGATFLPRKFFQQWFRENGSAYFFLFQKNLSVTNIQVGELLALLRTYVRRSDTKERVRDLQFTSTYEFMTSVQGIVESHALSGSDDDMANHICHLYKDLLRNVVVTDLYCGSCVVFLPPNLSIDPLPICALSGFIHSCGPSILSRNIIKATKKELFEKVDAFLERYPSLPAKPKFIVYAHEDYSPHDTESSSELRHGLSDVKIHVEKYYVGSQPLVSVLKEIKERYSGRLEVPEPAHFKKLLEKEKKEELIPPPSATIWLIIDRRPASEPRHKSDRQYFLCYFQEYRNENALLVFDENKPAWIDHTTLPHSLTAAMLNLARPWCPATQRTITVGDPFVGTGTTVLESLKQGANVIGADNCPIVKALVGDNLTFFCMSTEELSDLREKLMEAESFHPKDRSKTGTPFLDEWVNRSQTATAYFWALDVFGRMCPNPHSAELDWPQGIAREINASDFEKRVFLYLALRTYKRRLAALERQAEDWQEAYKSQSGELRRQIDKLLRLRQRQAEGHKGKEGIVVFPGWYSPSCGVEPHAFKSVLSPGGLSQRILEQKIEEMSFPARQCDVIVTDPPYGFNTRQSPEELAVVYRDLVAVMMLALKDEGQIILALPDWSHTGRHVPFFITKQIVIKQVLAAADENGREVFQEAGSAPEPSAIFKAPYYWESEKALRRAILHFRLRKRPVPGKRSGRDAFAQ